MVKLIFYAMLAEMLLIMAGIAWVHFRSTPDIRVFSDSQTYREAASNLFSREGWSREKIVRAHARPPVYPVLLAAARQNLGVVAFGQMLFSVFSWSLLAAALFCAARSYLSGMLGALLVLIFSLSPDIVGMYRVILTESISFSLLAGACGAALFYLSGSRGRWLIALAAYASLYALVRDSNAYLVLMAAALIGAAALWRILRHRRDASVRLRPALAGLAAAGCMLAAFLVANWTSNLGQRWLFPFQNVVAQRILVSPARVEWFRRQGMPVSDALMRMRGKWASSDGYAFDRAPELAAFRAWSLRYGKGAYMRWLLSHPGYLVGAPAPYLRLALSASVITRAPILYHHLQSPFYLGAMTYVVWGFVAGLLLSANLLRGSARTRRLMLLPLLLLALGYPHFLVAWHGDAMDIERHCAQVAMQVQLAVVLIAALAFDTLGALLAGVPSARFQSLFQKIALILLKRDQPGAAPGAAALPPPTLPEAQP